MKSIKGYLLFISCLFLVANSLYAEEVTILYSGQTHAMLYPCSCPIQQEGGVARRGTLIKELRRNYPNLLLLDCGSFTAGGLLDENTQSTRLDRQRSENNFQAMQLLQYDAVGISPDEFNFDKDFFLANASRNNPVFLSANLDSDKVSPYIIKEVNGIKIAIIGLTNLAANEKSEGIKISEPESVKKIINLLKRQQVKLIVVLSTLGEKEDLKLIFKVKGIDLIFVGWSPLKGESLTKVDATYFLRPAWQGRKLGKITLQIEQGKLIDCKVEMIGLSDKIADDLAVSKILPRCYSNVNCRKTGLVGSCRNPGELESECFFKHPEKEELNKLIKK